MTITCCSVCKTYLAKTLAVLFFMSSLLLLCSQSIKGQSDYGSTPLGEAPGSPLGSYSLSNIDNVNLFNGHVNIQIPVLSVAGRGGAKRQMFFNWSSPARFYVREDTDAFGNPLRYVEPSTVGVITDGLNLGSVEVYGVQSGWGSMYCGADSNYIFQKTLTRLYIVEADGTEHEMRDIATGGKPLDLTPCQLSGPSRGKIFVSTDGMGATFIADDPVQDYVYPGNGFPYVFPSGYLMLKSGTRFRISGSGPMRDRNGNEVSLTSPNSTQIQLHDSLNRQTTVDYVSGSQCSALGGSTYYCQKISYNGFGAAPRTIWLTYDTNLLPFELILPNNLRYRFYYNLYFDLTRIDLPAGGSIEYDYGAGLDGPQPNLDYWIQGAIPGTYWGGGVGPHVYRRVTERRLYKEGHVLESRQTFSKPENIYNLSPDGSYSIASVGYLEKKQYDSGNNPLGSERHFFYGSAEFSFAVDSISYPAWKDGREYHTEIYDQSGNLLRQTDQTWEQRAPVSWWTGIADDAPQNDPRVAQTTTRLENGLASMTAYSYDPTVSYNSLTDIYTYDYGNGTPGALLRHTQTTYLKLLNGVDYSGSNIQSGTSPYLRDFPLQVSIFDSVGVERSRTAYEYDNYNTDTNHAGLVARANISGLDATYNTSFTIRGNVTGTTSYLLNDGTVVGSIGAYAQYDVAGNVVKTIDPRGNPTSIYYDDHFGAPDGEVDGNIVPSELSTPGQSSFAFVTKAKNAANHIAYSQFDYYLGQAVDVKDANGVISSAYFNDVMDRPKRVINAVNQVAPIKSQSAFSYDDVNRIVTTTSDLSAYNDNLLKSQTLYDGLGRSVETRTYENATQFLTVKTIPFVVLQDPDNGAWVAATQTSNPFRQSEQPIWTTSFMDALGRVSKVRTPDTALLRTYYDGARTLVVDQLGKERLSLTNALGELKDVWEIKSTDAETEAVSFPGRPEVTAGYRTSYEYDAVNHLTKVIQGTQAPRFFTYDTLGLLKSAVNPENGTINYQYDSSGNVIVKTDARGVSAHYSYDGLGRPVRRWYNGSNLTTATTHNVPTLPSGIGVSEEVNYWYDSQTLPAGAPSSPSFERGPSTGRLVATSYGTGSSAGDYYGYDAGGRAVLKIQQTGGVNYRVTADYNASGRITSGHYPSLHSVSYDYDGAGRPLSFAGNLGDGTQRNYSSGTTYSALGGLSQEQFGTAIPIYNKLFYNVRGQLAEIREGTTPNNTDFERGAIINFYSGCWGMCAGQPMPDNNGNLKRQEHWVKDQNGTVVAINTQAFEYDSLNRLTRVYEGSASQPAWQQTFLYDRFGNRRLDVNATTASLSPKDFEVQPSTNRLLAPGDTNLAEINRQMRYDPAGNLTTDNYTGQGQRIYDAENHMTQASAAGQWQTYTYDGGGQRVRRNVGGVETWQVYGLGGELLAEYSANDPATTPQKEYGYRNGQLLIVAGTGAATAPAPSSLAAAPSSGGGNVVLTWSAASGAASYRVERKGATGSFVLAGTTASPGLTDTGASAGSAYLYRVCAANAQGTCTSVFSNIALGAAVSFPTDPTITSIADDPTGVTVTKVKAAHITELRTAVNAVRTLAGQAGAQWTNQTLTATVTFISADDVRDLRTKLDEALTALGIQTSNYDDQTLAGAPNGTVIKKVHITQLRQRSTSGIGGAGGSSPNQFGVQWLVTDQLGTPRMVFDETGSLSNVKRHDYLPFGEDLVAGSRATTPGYGAADGVRQKFTGYERDGETTLDFAHARYVSNVQGRFTGPDPFMLSADPWQPQSMNRYTYVLNNPLNNTDPLGLYYVGNGAKDPFIKEFKQDPEKGDFPEWDPKDTIIIIIRADKKTGRRISEDEASAISIRNMVVGMSLADEFDQKAAQAQPSGPYFHALEDDTGATEMAWEFFSGRGPRDRYFGPSAAMTRNMMTSPDVAAHRQRFIQQGGGMYGPTSVKFGWSAQDGPYTAAKSGPIENGPRQFVGSFTITIREGSNGDALFTLRNTTSLRSLLYDLPQVENVQRSDMLPLSNKTQEFWWFEKGLIKH
ncbi:MAG: RHS repeat-associated core domain-containing protein [Pyrinomonadaceae bacterium]